MRGAMTAAVAVIVIAAGSAYAEGGFALCVKPGMLVNAAQAGYKSDNLFAGVGCEFATVGFTSKYTHTESSYSYTNTDKYDVSLFLPQIAFRYFFGGTESGGGGGEVRPYAAAAVFYSFATARIESSDRETTYRDTTSERQLRDALGGNVGGTVAVGGEYFFVPSFSIGGEFGCRMLFLSAETTNEYYGYSSMTSVDLGLGVVYTALGLNFYF